MTWLPIVLGIVLGYVGGGCVRKWIVGPLCERFWRTEHPSVIAEIPKSESATPLNGATLTSSLSSISRRAVDEETP